MATRWTVCAGCSCSNHNIPAFTLGPLPSLGYTPELEDLTRTNDEPLPAEEQTLRAFLAEVNQGVHTAENAIKSLTGLVQLRRQEIHFIERQLLALELQRANFITVRDEARSMLTPVRRLPSEILLLIFRYTADHTVERTMQRRSANKWEWEVTIPRNHLWSIELVCKRWRQEVIAASRLWTYIPIVITSQNFAKGQFSYIRRLGIHLGRTSNHPLSLIIHKPATERTSLIPDMVTSLLFPFAARIHHLDLVLPNHMVAQLMPLKHSLHSLRSISIHNVQRNPPLSIATMHNLFTDAKLIRSVELFNVNEQINLDWGSVKAFAATHISEPQFGRSNEGFAVFAYLRLLWDMKTLVECTIRCEHRSLLDDSRFAAHGMPTRITCNNMTSLTLTAGHYQVEELSIAQLLGCIRLPVLQRLKVDCLFVSDDHGSDTYRRSELEAICEVLTRSQSPLTSLHFNHGYITPALNPLLRALTNLADIRLTDIRDSCQLQCPSVLRNLLVGLRIQPQQEPSILPHLRTLHLSGVMLPLAATFGDAILSRWRSERCARLEDVSLRWFSENIYVDNGELIMSPDPAETARSVSSRLRSSRPRSALLDLGLLY